MSEISRILEALAAAPAQPAALATLVEVTGSSYRRPGARLLLRGDGTKVGSVSGGCLEDDLCLRAETVLADGVARLARYDTTVENDLVWGVGLGCEGVVQVLVERIGPQRPAWIGTLQANLSARLPTDLSVVYGGVPAEGLGTGLGPVPQAGRAFTERVAPSPALVVCGAGDDAQPLVRMARDVGWRVTVADTRPAYATRERFAGADEILAGPAGLLEERLPHDPGAFAVVMSHRFMDDAAFLRVLLARPLAYVGVLGPRKRTDRLLALLLRESAAMNKETLARLSAPVGLDLGAATPESIALSILAEMQCGLSGRSPIHLRDREGPIYG